MVGGPYPPGSYQYSFDTHRHQTEPTACGNPYCSNFTAMYHRIRCTSGAGVAFDGTTVTARWDLRTYVGTGTFWSANNFSVQHVFDGDGDELESDWSGGGSGVVTTQAVSYQIGLWQGGAEAWVSRTTTGAF